MNKNSPEIIGYLTQELVCRSKTLTSHFISRYDQVNRWYKYPCYDLPSIQQRLLELSSFSNDIRQKISRVLVAQQQRFNAQPAAVNNAEQIAKSNTVVVIAGQQAGILGGPLLTLYKAIAAIRFAQNLQQHFSHYNFVPVFWIASEDHDFAEITTGAVPVNTGIANFEYRYPKDEPSRPAYEQVFSADIEHMLKRVLELVGKVSDTNALEVCRQGYRLGGNVVEAFGMWMSWLLSEYGLVVFDPSDLDVKKIGLDFMQKILSVIPQIYPELIKRYNELEQAGYNPQVSITPGDTQLFRVDRNGRQKLSYHTDDKLLYIADGRSFSIEELQQQLQDNPRLLSPGVLIRPVWQDYLLPVVMQIGGSAEISYMAQVNTMHQLLEVTEPVLAVRPGLTLISSSDSEFIQKYNVDVLKLHKEVTSEIDRALNSEFPPELDKLLNTLHNQFHYNLDQLATELAKLDQGLVRTSNSLAVNLDNFIENLRNKINKVIRGKHPNVVMAFQTLASHIFPNGNLQERVFTVGPLIFRYGRQLVQAVYNHLPATPCEHPIVVIKLID